MNQGIIAILRLLMLMSVSAGSPACSVIYVSDIVMPPDINKTLPLWWSV